MSKLAFYNILRKAFKSNNEGLLTTISSSLLNALNVSMSSNRCDCIPSKMVQDTEYNPNFICRDRGPIGPDEFRDVVLTSSMEIIEKKYSSGNVFSDKDLVPDELVSLIISRSMHYANNYAYQISINPRYSKKYKTCIDIYKKTIMDFAESFSPKDLSESGSDFDCNSIKEDLMPLVSGKSLGITEKDLDDAVAACSGEMEGSEGMGRREAMSFLCSRMTAKPAMFYEDSFFVNIIAEGIDLEEVVASIYALWTVYSGAPSFMLSKNKAMWLVKKIITTATIYMLTSLSSCLVEKAFDRMSLESEYNKKVLGKNLLIIAMGVEIQHLNKPYIEIFGEKISTQNPEARIDQAYSFIISYIEKDIAENGLEYAGCVIPFFE